MVKKSSELHCFGISLRNTVSLANFVSNESIPCNLIFYLIIYYSTSTKYLQYQLTTIGFIIERLQCNLNKANVQLCLLVGSELRCHDSRIHISMSCFLDEFYLTQPDSRHGKAQHRLYLPCLMSLTEGPCMTHILGNFLPSTISILLIWTGHFLQAPREAH